MSHGRGPNWGLIAALSLIATTAAAVVILVIAEDLAWLAVVVLGIGLVDAYFLWRVIPRFTGATTPDRLDRLNTEAQAEAELVDDEWGGSPPPDQDKPEPDS